MWLSIVGVRLQSDWWCNWSAGRSSEFACSLRLFMRHCQRLEFTCPTGFSEEWGCPLSHTCFLFTPSSGWAGVESPGEESLNVRLVFSLVSQLTKWLVFVKVSLLWVSVRTQTRGFAPLKTLCGYHGPRRWDDKMMISASLRHHYSFTPLLCWRPEEEHRPHSAGPKPGPSCVSFRSNQSKDPRKISTEI